MKIFIIESPNPNDLLVARNERSSLENMCRMFGHEASSFFTYSSADFKKILHYLSGIKLLRNEILCLHFSCHGNDEGIWIGEDFIYWQDFQRYLTPFFKDPNIGNRTFIIISSCGANGQQITDRINSLEAEIREELNCPMYFFVYNQDEVPWSDALLCWAILYHQLGKTRVIEKKAVQQMLRRIQVFGDLMYFRWDSDKLKYLKFIP